MAPILRRLFVSASSNDGTLSFVVQMRNEASQALKNLQGSFNILGHAGGLIFSIDLLLAS